MLGIGASGSYIAVASVSALLIDASPPCRKGCEVATDAALWRLEGAKPEEGRDMAPESRVYALGA